MRLPLVLVGAVLLATAPAAVARPTQPVPGVVRATFYDLGYPEGWRAPAARRHRPSLGRYRTAARATVRAHVRALDHGRFDAALAGWDGRTARTRRLRELMDVTARERREVRWAARLRAEATGSPSPRRIAALLNSVGRSAARHPAYLRSGGRPVVVVEVSAADRCADVARWVRVNNGWSHLVVEGVPRAGRCRLQPAAWFAGPRSGRLTRAPGAATAAPPRARHARALRRFRSTLRRLDRSRARWRVVASFNEWRRGRAVESAQRWRSLTGFGTFLDAVRDPHAPPLPPTGSRPPVLAAAGDIACDPQSTAFNGGEGTADACRQSATAKIAATADAVATLGDNQYEDGTLAAFRGSFDRSWGRLRGLHPVVGNHEYRVESASGYFDYFNGEGVDDGRAGTRGKGWYAFELGEWSVVVLNSNCGRVSCEGDSEQAAWLRDQLAARPRACTVALMHHPRFSSGRHGDSSRVIALWEILSAAGVDLVLAGHDHDYERFAPQDPRGRADTVTGLRSFVVGTGGHSLRPVGAARANSEVRVADAFGVLLVELGSSGYEWRFVDTAGAVRDRGADLCR